MADGGEARRRRLPRGWLLVLQLVLTVALVWLLLRAVGLSLDQLGGVELSRWLPDPWIFLASCGLLFVGYLVSGILWGRMVRDLGGGELRHRTAIRLYFVSNLGRYIPGKLWQVAGLALLAREEGVPARIATAAAIVGQGIALVAATLVGSAALVSDLAIPRATGIWILAILLALLGTALVPGVLRRLFALWFRLARAEPPEDVVPTPGFALRWTALYVVNWVVYAASFWLLARSFGLPGSVVQAGSAFAAAYVLGYAVLVAPAGIGVRESFLTVLLGPVMGAPTAATLSVVARLWTTGVEVVPAGGLWLRRIARTAGPGWTTGQEDEGAGVGERERPGLEGSSIGVENGGKGTR